MILILLGLGATALVTAVILLKLLIASLKALRHSAGRARLIGRVRRSVRAELRAEARRQRAITRAERPSARARRALAA
jgi:hypothetical protein